MREASSPAWPMQRVVGDARRIPLRDNAVPLIVTSPP